MSYAKPFDLFKLYEGADDIIDIRSYNLPMRFRYWNDKVFDGKIPKLDVVGFKAMKDATGRVEMSAKVSGYKKRNIDELIYIKLFLSKNFEYNQERLDSILLHEMIHAYLATVDRINVNHGGEFMDKLKEISKKSGIDITVTDEISEPIKTESPMGVMVVKKGDGKKSVMFMTPSIYKKNKDKFVEYIKKSYRFPKNTILEYGIANTYLHNTYPTARSKASLYVFDDKDYDSLKWDNKQTISLG